MPLEEAYVHISAKLAQGLVEVVHLRQDADHDYYGEDVGGWIRQLVVAAEG